MVDRHSDKKRILFADDEPELVEVVKERLEANNYEVITACDGEDCWDKIQKESPDLVLLDIQMPKLDGLKVLQKIRRDPKTQDIPVVMLTAKRHTNFLFRVKEFSRTDYLMKPFQVEDLLKCIARAI